VLSGDRFMSFISSPSTSDIMHAKQRRYIQRALLYLFPAKEEDRQRYLFFNICVSYKIVLHFSLLCKLASTYIYYTVILKDDIEEP
jgi:hypothetical protein